MAKNYDYEKLGITKQHVTADSEFPEPLQGLIASTTSNLSVSQFFSELIRQAQHHDIESGAQFGNGLGPLEAIALNFIQKYEAFAQEHIEGYGAQNGGVSDEGHHGSDGDAEEDHAEQHQSFGGIDALHRAALQSPPGANVALADPSSQASVAGGAGAGAGVPQFFVVTTNPATGMMSAVPAGSLALNVSPGSSTPVIVTRGLNGSTPGQIVFADSQGVRGEAHYEKKKGKHECTYPQCGRFFTRASNLRSHVRICHEGEKQFPCDQCDLKFSRKHDVVRHQSVHSGAKPHQCPHGCERAFSREDALNRHIKAKHADKIPSTSETVSPETAVHQPIDAASYQMSREEVNASLSTLVQAIRMGAPLTFFQGGYPNFSGGQVGVQVVGSVDERDDGGDGEVHMDDEGAEEEG